MSAHLSVHMSVRMPILVDDRQDELAALRAEVELLRTAIRAQKAARVQNPSLQASPAASSPIASRRSPVARWPAGPYTGPCGLWPVTCGLWPVTCGLCGPPPCGACGPLARWPADPLALDCTQAPVARGRDLLPLWWSL